MRWMLNEMKVSETKFFEYNEYSKRDIKGRLVTMMAYASKNYNMKFKTKHFLDGVICERIA